MVVTRAGHHRAHMCVEVGGGAWSIGPWSACGGCASRAPMTRQHGVATGGFQRGGVPADGHPSRGATNRASHEHGLHRHMEIDEHGWLQENARDTPTPRPSHWSGRERIDGIRWEWEGSARVYRTRPRTTNPKGLRTDGHHRDRPSAADAAEHPCQTPNRGVSPASPLRGVRPPDCRRRSRYAPLPRRSIARNNAAISGSVGVGIGTVIS